MAGKATDRRAKPRSSTRNLDTSSVAPPTAPHRLLEHNGSNSRVGVDDWDTAGRTDAPRYNCQPESECPAQNPNQPAKAMSKSLRRHVSSSTPQSATGVSLPPRINPHRYTVTPLVAPYIVQARVSHRPKSNHETTPAAIGSKTALFCLLSSRNRHHLAMSQRQFLSNDPMNPQNPPLACQTAQDLSQS